MSKYFKPRYGFVPSTSFAQQAVQNISQKSTPAAKGAKLASGFMTLPVQKKKGVKIGAKAGKKSSALASSASEAFATAAIEFAYTNPTQEQIEQRFKNKTARQIRGIRSGIRSKMEGLKAQLKILEGMAASGGLTQTMAAMASPEDILAVKGKIASLEGMYSILGTLLEAKTFGESQEKADQKAIDRGYKNAEEAQAIRQVEIEWYFKLYGTDNPIEILAYQKIERKKYGMTSYEAALNGQQLVEPASIEAEANRQEAQAEAEEIAGDILAAEEDKKKKQMFAVSAIGILAVAGGAWYFFGRKK